MSWSGRNSVCLYRERVQAFWDAKVSPEERRRIEAHLSECAACRQHLQELQSLAAALQAFRTPASGWSSDAEFWQRLAPKLHPRVIPGPRLQGRQPSPLLAPVSLVASSLVLRGVATLALIAYALHQFELLPAVFPTAFASAMQLVLGPWVWQTSQLLYSDMVSSLASFWAPPGQLWLLALQGTTSAILLLIAGLHTGWLIRWLRGQSLPQATIATE